MAGITADGNLLVRPAHVHSSVAWHGTGNHGGWQLVMCVFCPACIERKTASSRSSCSITPKWAEGVGGESGMHCLLYCVCQWLIYSNTVLSRELGLCQFDSLYKYLLIRTKISFYTMLLYFDSVVICWTFSMTFINVDGRHFATCEWYYQNWNLKVRVLLSNVHGRHLSKWVLFPNVDGRHLATCEWDWQHGTKWTWILKVLVPGLNVDGRHLSKWVPFAIAKCRNLKVWVTWSKVDGWHLSKWVLFPNVDGRHLGIEQT